MRTPEIDQVLEVHRDVVERAGGKQGVRSMTALESALAQPQMTFEGHDLYPTIEEKAAALCFSLVRNHPFLDGNKRVGYATTEIFLLMNGYELSASVYGAERAMILLASGDLTRDELTHWIRDHIKRFGARRTG